MAAGMPLGDVLQEFMSDVVEACRKGARVVAHQIEEILFPSNRPHSPHYP